MKYLALSISLLLTSCATFNLFGKNTIEDFKPHMFSADQNFILENAKCENVFMTDSYNSVDNEIFRCSVDSSNTFITLESDGNNSEDLLTATLIWKEWSSDLNYENSRIKAQQLAAVFAEMYARDKKYELVDAFFNNGSQEFKSQLYTIYTESDYQHFYTVRKAQVVFNK